MAACWPPEMTRELNLTLFRLADGTNSVLERGGRVNQIVFSADGRYMAYAGDDGSARVFETSRWKLLFQIKHPSQIPAVAFSWDGGYGHIRWP